MNKQAKFEQFKPFTVWSQDDTWDGKLEEGVYTKSGRLISKTK